MPFTSETAREAGAKGGKTITEKRRLAQSLAKRKYCSTECRIFEKCPFKAIAFQDPDKICALKKLPDRVRRRFQRLFIDGEEGLIDEIKELLYEFSLEIDNEEDKKIKLAYLDRLLKFYQIVYGAKMKLLPDSEVKVKVKIEKISPEVSMNENKGDDS